LVVVDISEEKQTQFLRIFEPFEKQISNYCRALTGNESNARDLLQETILQIYTNLDRLLKAETPQFYMCGVARNIYLNSQRRLKFWVDINKSGVENAIANNQSAEINIEVQILYNAIARLPFKHREALVMFEIMGFSLAEIQQHQGGTLSGVKSRIARARHSLSEMLVSLDKASTKTINKQKP
jgi:RNA polymerase sigma-70 factor (ECF subfamily)